MANSVDPDLTAPIGAVCSGSMLSASILSLLVMICNYLQQTTSAGDISDAFFLGTLRVDSQRTLYSQDNHVQNIESYLTDSRNHA